MVSARAMFASVPQGRLRTTTLHQCVHSNKIDSVAKIQSHSHEPQSLCLHHEGIAVCCHDEQVGDRLCFWRCTYKSSETGSHCNVAVIVWSIDSQRRLNHEQGTAKVRANHNVTYKFTPHPQGTYFFYNSTASTWTLATPRTTWESDYKGTMGHKCI